MDTVSWMLWPVGGSRDVPGWEPPSEASPDGGSREELAGTRGSDSSAELRGDSEGLQLAEVLGVPSGGQGRNNRRVSHHFIQQKPRGHTQYTKHIV